MRPSANTATLGVAFVLVNLGLLVFMGAPLPPQPYLSMLVVFLVNLLLFAYTPVLVRWFGGAGNRRGEVAYHAVEHSPEESSYQSGIIVWRTRILIYIANWFTILVRGSFKDGQYTNEYHTDIFAAIMFCSGFLGGVVCLVCWFGALREPLTTITPQASVNESLVTGPADAAEENSNSIQLADATWDKAADKV